MNSRIGAYLRRHHLALLCLFLILGGGTAWAVERDSVRSGHIVDGQVRTPDIRDGAVTGPKLAASVRSYIVEIRRTVVDQQAKIGELEDTVAAQGARIGELEGDVGDLEGTVESQVTTISGLQSDVGDLETLLAGVSRQTLDGNDTLHFSGMNLQLVNGQGAATKNGLGNLIVGYNRKIPFAARTRTGSHYVVVGDAHEWSSFGGLITGWANTASGADGASVLGGQANTASGQASSVLGGQSNTASGHTSSVSGGGSNTASGGLASVSSGQSNTASGLSSSILGSENKTVTTRSQCWPAC